jgi:RND superfamily putative drug exporter
VIRLAAAGLRRPKLTVAIWLGCVLLLAGQARVLEGRLSPPDLLVPGTDSAHDDQVASAHFGPNLTVPILLVGPPRAVDAQGVRLSRALAARRLTTVLSPWTPKVRGAPNLRPSPGRALVIALYRRPLTEGLEVADEVERVAANAVHAPVEAHISGQPTIGKGLKAASLDSARQAEQVVLPMLLVVLVLVFGSPVAAGVAVGFGGATVLAGLGMVSVLALGLDIQPLAVSLASMIGLALGVDYSLLIVSRFRDELGGLSPPDAAAAASIGTAGRTVIHAGAALVAALAVTVALAPGSLILSASLASGVVVMISIASAVLVVPAALILIGDRIDSWRIRSRAGAGAGLAVRASRRLTRRPALMLPLLLIPLLALAVPAAAFDPNSPGVGQLPEHSKVRRDYELVSRVMGRGWTAPIEVIAVAREGTVTTERRLRQLERLERTVARDHDVAVVIGPAAVGSATRPARNLRDRIEVAVRTGQRDLGRLRGGATAAGDGARQLRAGLGAAATGAGRLASGDDEARRGGAALALGARAAADGADRLHDGLRLAATGSDRLATGSPRALAGARRLAAGLATVESAVRDGRPGIDRLAAGLSQAADGSHRLREPARIVDEELANAYRELSGMSVGKADPRYVAAFRAVARARGASSGRDPTTGRQVAAGYEGLEPSLAKLEAGLGQAAAGTTQLQARSGELVGGLSRLRAGAAALAGGLRLLSIGDRRLSRGVGQLAAGSSRLVPGLARLAGGAGRLEGGLGQLADGANRLAGGLAAGRRRSTPLVDGLDRMAGAVANAIRRLPRLAPDTRGSPGFFESGYVTMAALDGAAPRDRELSGTIVSLDRGGRAARFLVIPRSGPGDGATAELRDRLDERAQTFSRSTDLSMSIGGEGAILADFDRATQSRIVPIVAALSLITFLVLLAVFRSLILPAVAVGLTLATVVVTYGVMTLLLQGAHPILGGPGYVSSLAALGTFAVIFALSIDYVVFLVARMREGYDRALSADAAIDHGLLRTGRVVTGAALIMISVFVSFSLTDFSGIREFGVGLAVAVAIDATIMRMLLLPAIMRMLGDRSWWLPRWLGVLLPRERTAPPQPVAEPAG